VPRRRGDRGAVGRFDHDGAQFTAGSDVGLGALELTKSVRVLEEHVGGLGEHQSAAAALGDRLADRRSSAASRGDGQGADARGAAAATVPWSASAQDAGDDVDHVGDLTNRVAALMNNGATPPRLPYPANALAVLIAAVGRELRRHPRWAAALPPPFSALRFTRGVPPSSARRPRVLVPGRRDRCPGRAQLRCCS
jgi:hypothetical protein